MENLYLVNFGDARLPKFSRRFNYRNNELAPNSGQLNSTLYVFWK